MSARDHPDWLIGHLLQEWDTSDAVKAYPHKTLIEFGEALGIAKDGVKPITASSYEFLKSIKIPGVTDPDDIEKARQAILSWFKDANFASLSARDSKILDFNLSYTDAKRRPWWNDEQMKLWLHTGMPYHVMAPIGTLLKFGEAQGVSGERATVRQQILQILEDFAEHENIGKRLSDKPHSPLFGAIAYHLGLSTQFTPEEVAKSKGFTSEFQLKYERIRLHPHELAGISEAIHDGRLAWFGENLKNVVVLEMRLDGIDPKIGFEYAVNLEHVRSKSTLSLMTGGNDARQAMDYLLPRPRELWGGTDWSILKPTLEHHFSQYLTEPVVKRTVWKAKLARAMNKYWQKFLQRL